MALTSMTGFARTDGDINGVRWAWEAKSVNGRGLDVKTRTPPGFDALEPTVREGCARRFTRGSIQIGLTLRRDPSVAAATLDLAFIERLLAAGEPYIAAGRAAPPAWDGLLAIRGALASAETSADLTLEAPLQAALIAGLEALLAALDAARHAEGQSLARVLGALLNQIESLIQSAEGQAAAAPEACRARLLTRLAGLAPDIVFDPQRLAQEAALIAARADVREELDRLGAHVAQARALIAEGQGAGRKLDFLAQEFNREANTLCSKASELALTRLGLELKTVIDQFREQAANVA